MRLILILLCLFAFYCGEQKNPVHNESQTTQINNQEAGVTLAREILTSFDQLVKETFALVKDQPETQEVRIKIEKLYDKYYQKMILLNEKYLKLKKEDSDAFASANRYLNENRPRHVFQKDQLLSNAIAYYNFQQGDQQMVELLSRKIVAVLDAALKD